MECFFCEIVIRTPLCSDKTIEDLGNKISVNMKDCRPKQRYIITPRVEMELTKPLKRRKQWNINSGKAVQIRYHWDKQPHSFFQECYTVDHNDEGCAGIVAELNEDVMIDEKYARHIQE